MFLLEALMLCLVTVCCLKRKVISGHIYSNLFPLSQSSGSVDVHINMDQSTQSEPRMRLQLAESLLRETQALIHRLEVQNKYLHPTNKTIVLDCLNSAWNGSSDCLFSLLWRLSEIWNERTGLDFVLRELIGSLEVEALLTKWRQIWIPVCS